MARKSYVQSMELPINPWERVDMENGMLTDKLARSAQLSIGSENLSTKLGEVQRVPASRVLKKMPRKFR